MATLQSAAYRAQAYFESKAWVNSISAGSDAYITWLGNELPRELEYLTRFIWAFLARPAI